MNGKNNKYRLPDKYRAILHLPHYVSSKHPPMPVTNRAAQFTPFAALTGYEELLAEENVGADVSSCTEDTFFEEE